MALPDVQQAGSNAYVARLIQLTFNDAQILSRLRERFPTETDRTLQAALRQGHRAYSAGLELGFPGADNRLLASQVPSSGDGGLGWRYYTQATIISLATGSVRVVSFTIESQQNLNQGEVAAQVLLAAQASVAPNRPRVGSDPIDVNFVVTNLEFVAVERASV